MGPLQQDDAPYVSTGQLPSPEQVRRSVDEAYERYRIVAGGENSRVYPALVRVPADLFGICAVGTSGGVYATGDADHGFAIMSVAKPFVFALVYPMVAGPGCPCRDRGGRLVLVVATLLLLGSIWGVASSAAGTAPSPSPSPSPTAGSTGATGTTGPTGTR